MPTGKETSRLERQKLELKAMKAARSRGKRPQTEEKCKKIPKRQAKHLVPLSFLGRRLPKDLEAEQHHYNGVKFSKTVRTPQLLIQEALQPRSEKYKGTTLSHSIAKLPLSKSQPNIVEITREKRNISSKEAILKQ